MYPASRPRSVPRASRIPAYSLQRMAMLLACHPCEIPRREWSQSLTFLFALRHNTCEIASVRSA